MKFHKVCSVLMALVAGCWLTNSAMAQDIEVLAADPMTAEQGTIGLDVEVQGKGFAKGATVRFILFDTEEYGGIDVNSVKVRGPNKLIANINVAEGAQVDLFNIEVSVRGRKGKGTTWLFAVQEKKTIYTCSEAFGVSYPDQCSCTFTVNDETGQSGHPPMWIWNLRDDCSTYETLVIGQFEKLASDGNSTITARGPFTGSSVVAASGHRAQMDGTIIHIDNSVAAGCGPGLLNSAIGFVLDGGSADPEAQPFPPAGSYRKTLWQVWLNTISSGGPALCHAIELRRTQDYNDNYPGPVFYDFQASVSNNVIQGGSYAQSGVLLQGFIPIAGESNSWASVSRNTIFAGTNASTNAVQLGPVNGPADATRNLVTASGGTGILALGDGSHGVTIEQNDIVGADIGVLVDDQASSALFKSNILAGDGPGGVFDIGICSDALDNSFRANKIKKFDDAISEAGCSILANPSGD